MREININDQTQKKNQGIFANDSVKAMKSKKFGQSLTLAVTYLLHKVHCHID